VYRELDCSAGAIDRFVASTIKGVKGSRSKTITLKVVLRVAILIYNLLVAYRTNNVQRHLQFCNYGFIELSFYSFKSDILQESGEHVVIVHVHMRKSGNEGGEITVK
jgi:hypothetical protein